MVALLATGRPEVALARPGAHGARHTRVPAASHPRKPAATSLGRPYYDPADRLLVVPYKGDEPAYARGTLRLPPRVYFDIDADAPGVGMLNEVVFDHPTWLGWAMAPHGSAGRTRLTFIFKRPTAVTVTVNAHKHVLRFLPALAFEKPPAPSPKPTPAETFPSPLPTASPSPVATPAESPLPMPELSSAVHPVVHPSLGPASPSAPPPASPTPVPRPTPAASPSATPVPSPVVPAVLPAATPPRLELCLPFETYDEGDPALGVAAHADGPLALGGRVRFAEVAPGWDARVDARVLGLAYADAAHALHARQEWGLTAALLHPAGWGAIGFESGVGYLARYQVAQASPAGTGYAFAPWRFAHGPLVLAGLRLPVIDSSGWAVRLSGGLAPGLFSAMPADVPALPWLWGYQLEVALDVPLGPWAMGVGYRRQAFTGGGYAEIEQGPFVTLGAPLGPR